MTFLLSGKKNPSHNISDHTMLNVQTTYRLQVVLKPKELTLCDPLRHLTTATSKCVSSTQTVSHTYKGAEKDCDVAASRAPEVDCVVFRLFLAAAFFDLNHSFILADAVVFLSCFAPSNDRKGCNICNNACVGQANISN